MNNSILATSLYSAILCVTLIGCGGAPGASDEPTSDEPTSDTVADIEAPDTTEYIVLSVDNMYLINNDGVDHQYGIVNTIYNPHLDLSCFVVIKNDEVLFLYQHESSVPVRCGNVDKFIERSEWAGQRYNRPGMFRSYDISETGETVLRFEEDQFTRRWYYDERGNVIQYYVNLSWKFDQSLDEWVDDTENELISSDHKQIATGIYVLDADIKFITFVADTEMVFNDGTQIFEDSREFELAVHNIQ